MKVKFNDIFFSDSKKHILNVDGLEIEGIEFSSFKRNIYEPRDDFLIKLASMIDIPARIKTDAEVIKEIQDLVQTYIDNVAKEKNYDNGFALANYSESTNEKFKNEALKFIPFRDQCWDKCYEILEQYQTGQIDRPEPEDIFEYLPIFRWPDGIIEEEKQDE